MSQPERNFSMRHAALCHVLKELQDAAELSKDVVSSVCSAVANMIVASGNRYGDAGMLRMMRLVESYGFQPEFYPNEIRVYFIAKESLVTEQVMK